MGQSRHLLSGDILELSLTNTNKTAMVMVFDSFTGLVMPRNKEFLERIIYIPGNHDHHLRELARETQYVESIRPLKGKEFQYPSGIQEKNPKDSEAPITTSESNLPPFLRGRPERNNEAVRGGKQGLETENLEKSHTLVPHQKNKELVLVTSSLFYWRGRRDLNSRPPA